MSVGIDEAGQNHAPLRIDHIDVLRRCGVISGNDRSNDAVLNEQAGIRHHADIAHCRTGFDSCAVGGDGD